MPPPFQHEADILDRMGLILRGCYDHELADKDTRRALYALGGITEQDAARYDNSAHVAERERRRLFVDKIMGGQST